MEKGLQITLRHLAAKMILDGRKGVGIKRKL